MTRNLVAAALVLIPLTLVRGIAPPGKPAVHDVNAMPWTSLRPGIQIKPVIGETGTFVLGEFDPAARTLAHHHTYEQANLGLTGLSQISIGGHVHRLGPLAGTMAPADAEHVIENNGAMTSTLLEFEPVRRLDLLPPRPALTFPARPDAAAVAARTNVSADFGTAEAHAAGSSVLSGRTCTLSVWRVPATPQAVTLMQRAPGAEQFLYLVEGRVELGVAPDRKPLAPGTLVVNPPGAPAIRVRALDADPAVLAIFEPAATRPPTTPGTGGRR